jgi:hypothetical protein
VTLNTPGYQDGVFRLEVNGEVVLDLTDVFYRDVQNAPKDPDPPNDGDGLLGPILGGLLGGLALDDDGTQVRTSAAQKGSSGAIGSGSGTRNVEADSPTVKKSVERRADRHAKVAHEDNEPIGFKGIFFRYVLSVHTTQNG